MSDSCFPDWAPEDLHHSQTGDSAGKGCLTKCGDSSKKPSSGKGKRCAYRWQAYEKAKGDKEVYNYEAYKDFCVDTKGDKYVDARTTEKGTFPPYSQLNRYKPTHDGKEWDIGDLHPKNFWSSCIRPYWHNSHHVVPASVLKNAITDSAETDSRLPDLIGKGLLKGEYNLHDQVNMMILPQMTTAAAALKLPRHLRQDQVGPGQSGEYCDHPDYSKAVKKKLDKAMREYANTLKADLKKAHPEAPSKLSKQAVEKISKDIYAQIKTKGASSPGTALSDLGF
jgi:hypothetical protein